MSKARDSLSDEHISMLEADYAEHGQETLIRLRETDAKSYLQLVSALTPKAAPEPPPATDLSALSVDELRERVGGLAGLRVELMAKDLPRYEAMLKQARRLAKQQAAEFEAAADVAPSFGMRARLEEKFKDLEKSKANCRED
jgi:hypothetical protein